MSAGGEDLLPVVPCFTVVVMDSAFPLVDDKTVGNVTPQCSLEHLPLIPFTLPFLRNVSCCPNYRVTLWGGEDMPVTLTAQVTTRMVSATYLGMCYYKATPPPRPNFYKEFNLKDSV